MATLSQPTLTELLAEARIVLGQTDDTNSNWSNTELTQYVNEAIRRYYQIIVQNAEGQFNKVTTLNITANQETITLPSDFFEIFTLKKVDQNDRIILNYRPRTDESHRVDGGTSSTLYLPYYYLRGNDIVLRPVPQFSETGALELEYVSFPETMVNGGDAMTSGISAIFRDTVVTYVVWKAKLAESLRGNGIQTYAPAERLLNDHVRALRDVVRERSYSPTAIKPFNAIETD